MLIKLKDIKPNSLRIEHLDPIDEESVQNLVTSIKKEKFWGGSVIRRNKNGELEAVSGSTRIAAAIAAGVKEADLTVVDDMSDARAIWIYAMENATQRRNSATAWTGSIASSSRFIIKGILSGGEKTDDVRQICRTSVKAIETVRGQIASGKGLGAEFVVDFLKGVPGVNISMVKAQFANLKASGDYTKIIEEVAKEIALEQAQERVELERREGAAAKAKKASEEAEAKRKEAQEVAKATKDTEKKKAAQEREKAAKREAEEAKRKEHEEEAKVEEMAVFKTTRDASSKAVVASNGKKPKFDLSGVQKHFRSEHVVRTFREMVTEGAMFRHLPFDMQAPLAESLVKAAKEADVQLSSTFIKNKSLDMMRQVVNEHGRKINLDAASKEELEKERDAKRWKDTQHDFARHVRGVIGDSGILLGLLEKYPSLKFTEEILSATEELSSNRKLKQLRTKMNL